MESLFNTELGKNLTGAMASPESLETQNGAVELTVPVPKGDADLFADNRILYMKASDPVGTLNVPSSLENISEVFLDKLGERIAFERTGTRLYEMLISKHKGTEDKSFLPALEDLEKFHLDELNHFQLASEVMAKLGGDPTAMTPAADISGVAAFGWVQAMSDPRTDFKQCLEIILQAELVDNACWEVLIELAMNSGLNDVAEKFEIARSQEMIHLDTIKQWVRDLNIDGKVKDKLSFH